jgi:RNA recognition motif-containing protein
MSLFIGNISKSVTATDLEKSFGEYGSCRINYKGSYAFAEFNAEKDAEDALERLQGKNIGGSQINLEWSRKSKKFDSSNSRRRRSISPRKSEGRCYNCGSRGHYLIDCRYC